MDLLLVATPHTRRSRNPRTTTILTEEAGLYSYRRCSRCRILVDLQTATMDGHKFSAGWSLVSYVSDNEICTLLYELVNKGIRRRQSNFESVGKYHCYQDGT